MGGHGGRPYREVVPTSRAPRLLVCAAAVCAAVVLVASQLGGGAEPRSEVGTQDDDTIQLDRAHPRSLPLPDLAGDGAATSATAGTPTTGGRAPSTSAGPGTTSAPSTTATRQGPAHLRGRIVYASSSPVEGSVWSMRPDGTDRRLEVACPTGPGAASGFDVSPDGTRLARTCGAGAVVQDVDDGETTVVGPSDFWAAPLMSWSPDGRHLALTRFVDQHVTVVDLATGGMRTITPDPPLPAPLVVSWSPDGTRLVTGTLDVIDVATGATASLVPLLPGVPGAVAHQATTARWAPNGWIYFQEHAGDGERSLLHTFDRLNPATGTVQRLLDIPDFLDWPGFLPDGRVVVRMSRTTVTVLAADGSSGHELDAPIGMTGFTAARRA